ncbi:LysE/ArgO family amino acid transporter [Shewanella schlegeliana]|uniref:Amino acid transporter n=1 Tax=Shewanella schlegeliana TaxID=190308 RepID=A0ABS1SZ08_9GAMM|nr:LysE/ArgO family amino acid transporter [Shewanella schlegeliana]MBL4913788.1 amino acid transporter [Shewanella schlegeliana]MCL1108827.1 LysE/ArgO family amino acid transporter [Shewanella schlegeliana]GIU25859.1 amino acid transporter [Shewanella schlegeliana]
MQTAFIQGMGIGGSLIMAVGAQNAFVLKQGLKRSHSLPIAAICSFIDAVMITAGVAGLGHLILAFPLIKDIASFGGALFLLIYGYGALKSSFSESRMESDETLAADSLKKAILTTLAISLLNPHLYLDTVVLLGSISVQFEGTDKQWFGAGAVLASFVWFFSLSLGAKYLSPVFKKPKAWCYLDRFICITMWSIAAALIYPYLA